MFAVAIIVIGKREKYRRKAIIASKLLLARDISSPQAIKKQAVINGTRPAGH